MGLFGVIRELQFRVCTHGEPRAGSPKTREGSFHSREKEVGRTMSSKKPMAFPGWVLIGHGESFFFLLSACAVAHLCLTLCDPMDCSLPGSSVHVISQARILEWVAILFSRGSFWPRDWTRFSFISCFGRWILYQWAPGKPSFHVQSYYFRVWQLSLLVFLFYLIEALILLIVDVFHLILNQSSSPREIQTLAHHQPSSNPEQCWFHREKPL